MKKIPTVEDYLKEKVYITQDDGEDIHDSLSSVSDAVRDLISLHVKRALKNAADNKFNASFSAGMVEHTSEAKKSILNSYPEDLIK